MKNGKSFRCEVLGWHTPTNIFVENLSVTFESVCKRCGRPIMQDSQGNWFSFAEKGGADMRNITETSSSCTTTNPNSVEVYHQSLKGGAV